MRIGKIITAIPSDGSEGKYICVAEATGYLWLVPTTGDLSSQHTKFIKTSGPDAWFITGEYEDKALVEDVMRRLEDYISLADEAYLDPSQAAKAQDNLHALKAACAYQSAFGEGCMIGRIVFVEFPRVEGELDQTGQYIVIAESDNSLYGVSTQHAIGGVHWKRIPLQGAKVISVYENDNQIDSVIENLTNFTLETPGDWDEAVYESANTTIWQLKNALEFKSKRRGGPFEICARPKAYSFDDMMDDILGPVEGDDDDWIGPLRDEDEFDDDELEKWDPSLDGDDEEEIQQWLKEMIDEIYGPDEDEDEEEDDEDDLFNFDDYALLDSALGTVRPLNPNLTGRPIGMLIG